MSKSETVKPVGLMLRLPPALREKLALRAKLNERSMNAEIIEMLEASLLAPSRRELRALLDDLSRYNQDIASLVQMLAAARNRRAVLMSDIERISGGEISVFPIENADGDLDTRGE